MGQQWHVEYGEGTKIKDAGGNTVLWTQHTHLRGRRADAEVKAIANLAAAAPDMLAALEAQERAENAHANCPDCEGEGDWTECGRCSELFGDAIDMRRAAIAKATT